MPFVQAATPEEHQALLSKYRATQVGSGWHTTPDDGYLYDHLAYHLKEAGLTNELKGLFADQNWFQARLRQNAYKYDGYLSDLLLAWDVASEDLQMQLESQHSPNALVYCF